MASPEVSSPHIGVNSSSSNSSSSSSSSNRLFFAGSPSPRPDAFTGSPAGKASSSSSSSSSPPSSLLQRVGFIEKQAHARSSSCCCCTDTHVFVGGSGLVGTVFVWRIVLQYEQQQQQQQQEQDQEQQQQQGLQFVGLLGRMASQVQKLILNPQGDTLLALTQAG
ncbi:hypothetical protein ETH_00028035 [Eimeria tenella]|uniref:Uncharacterized protein n=1 Tax=Eimeria tenella TaxID=5802 RepID=U6LBV8_EIMTE|nr:hypothetical protein ETH_00028035 [Eimeria tenella]CDJ45245.1 hypothetical protein ETH_00028035 [Eimeria tenella]|eukprot:XP_013235992.1 hypothetical protein ETH_00028035 [Eimeria tenella]